MKKQRKFLWTALLLFMVSIFAMGCVTVSAATKTGFVTIGGKTYYIKEDGTKQKGWLQLNATRDKTSLIPIAQGQEIIVVIGEQLVEEKIRAYWG